MSQENPTVSVLMPVYNAQKYVAEAVESVLNQTFSDFEFLIIDDGSLDDSLSILYRYAIKDRRIRLVSRANTGCIVAANEMIESAKGKYLARLDADDIALPERFAKQVEYLEQHPECVVVASCTLLIDSEGNSLCEMCNTFSHEQLYNCLIEGISIITQPTVMMRRESVQKVGGYDPKYPSAEEIELFLRLVEQGQLANIPEVLTKYRQHISSQGYAQQQIQLRSLVAAVNGARIRRGLPPLENSSARIYQEKLADHYRKWSWWALLGSKNVNTARKYAFAALREEPFSIESWRAMYSSWRGY